jgi:hypothetical protein
MWYLRTGKTFYEQAEYSSCILVGFTARCYTLSVSYYSSRAVSCRCKTMWNNIYDKSFSNLDGVTGYLHRAKPV